MERTLGRLSDRLIAISPEVRDDLVRFGVGVEEKIPIIPLGFDLTLFQRCERYRGELRKELGITPDYKLVGIVGRIFPVKNHRLFLEAAGLVKSARDKVHFVVVGDGQLRRQMEELAEQFELRSSVTFTGWRRDLPRIYADLDLLVVSSISEGTPVVAIEAMAAGCPVVGTKVGGMSSLIDDGRTGLLVESRDRTGLARRILEMLENPAVAARMAHAAREEVSHRFTVQQLVSKTEKLYRDLLRAKGITA